MHAAYGADQTTPDFGATPDEAAKIAQGAHAEVMTNPDFHMHGNETIAMLVYPNMTMLDLVGPQYFFASMMGAQVSLVTADDALNPVIGDTGFAIVPTMRAQDCP